MKPPLRKTPLELPRQTLYQKQYSAVLCGDGSIMPIEERLGRRLLRRIEPDSAEGRDLLARGWVSLRNIEGRSLPSDSLSRLYARLREEARTRLSERPADPVWCRHYDNVLETIDRWESALLGESKDH